MLQILISMPIGHRVRPERKHDNLLLFANAYIRGSFLFAEPYFPAASIRLHRQYALTDMIHEDSFLKGSRSGYFVRSRSRFSGGSFAASGTRFL